MTRFARGEGSKGSNKKELHYEQATSWEAMKADMQTAKTKKKKDKKKLKNETKDNSEVTVTQTNTDDTLSKRIANFDDDHSDGPLKKKKKSSSKEKITEEVSLPSLDLVQHDEKNTASEKKEKPLSLQQLKTNWVIEDGIKYKIFKDGKKKPWFDLAYEENDTMTRYINFFVKREVVDELDQYKKSLEEQGLDPREVTKKMLHKERKFHNHLRVELLRSEIKEKAVTEPKVTHKVKKNKGKEDHSSSPSKAHDENAVTEPKVSHKVKKNKNKEDHFSIPSKAHDENAVTEPKVSHKVKKNKGKEEEDHSSSPSKAHDAQNDEKKKDFSSQFVENDLMTQFEGYWILRENLAHIQHVAQLKYDRIMQQRTDGNSDQKLTDEEELMYRRLMKKEKRREEKLLRDRLKHRNMPISRSNFNYNEYKPIQRETQCIEPVVKFEGYLIRKDGAERLTKLKETMKENGCTEEEIENTIKNERRKEERILKRENKMFCFKCRSPGHMISFCPKTLTEGQAYDVCFKCGSAEHMARDCNVQMKNSGSSSYPLATCFICNEVGHISRECPDNPKGLYPNGGCCNECGSVEHLKRYCPEFQKVSEETSVKISTFCQGEEIEQLESDYNLSSEAVNQSKSKPKVIEFQD